MKVLTLEEWLKKFGDRYKCLRCFKFPDDNNEEIVRQQSSMFCKDCRQAYSDYQKAIAADKNKLKEFQRTQPKEQTS